MTPQVRRTFETRLRKLRRELVSSGPTKIEPSRTDDARVGQDEDEQPLNEMLQSVASGRNRNLAKTLALIDKALAKLKGDPDDFGSCEDCGDEIPKARLETLPYAEFCVACQARADGPKAGPTRKKITDYR
jgi:DnaK suppressor protein